MYNHFKFSFEQNIDIVMFLSLINDFNEIFDMLILHLRNSKKNFIFWNYMC